MSENSGYWHLLWLWTWGLVAISSAGYAIVNLLGSTPAEAAGVVGVLRYLLGVALPIGMCVLAIWLGVEEWRGGGEP